MCCTASGAPRNARAKVRRRARRSCCSPPKAGSAGRWISPGSRLRPVGSDPWQVPDGAASSGLPAQVTVADQGSLLIGGLEWMQARVYDPGSRGFL